MHFASTRLARVARIAIFSNVTSEEIYSWKGRQKETQANGERYREARDEAHVLQQHDTAGVEEALALATHRRLVRAAQPATHRRRVDLCRIALRVRGPATLHIVVIAAISLASLRLGLCAAIHAGISSAAIHAGTSSALAKAIAAHSPAAL